MSAWENFTAKLRESRRLDRLGCHASRDGDCNWKECPQEANNRADYQTCCPLMTDEQKDPYQ